MYRSIFTAACFKGFHRLGKYKPNSAKPRPILVKFLHMLDANIVLSDRAAITSSQISIKLDLTKEECEVKNVLLKRDVL